MENYLRWLPLLPYIAAHPKLEAAVAQNLPEFQVALQELSAFWTSFSGRHAKLIALIEAEAPEAMALNNELAPIIRQIQGSMT